VAAQLAQPQRFIEAVDPREVQQEGLVAAAYAPCEVSTTLNGTPVRVVVETNYPFHGEVHLTVHPASPLAFPLQLRIPAWATGATLTVNGQPQPAPAAGAFTNIARTWKPGDQIHLTFPMNPRLSRWFNNSVAIERGPLVFSYAIGESWVKLRDRGLTADWQVFPTTPWNYALLIDESTPSHGIETVARQSTPTTSPFTARTTPIQLKVKARKVPDWRAEDGAPNPLPKSPVATTEPEASITLTPYAAAKLRITAFPQAMR